MLENVTEPTHGDESISARVSDRWDTLARAERAVARHLAVVAPHDLMLATADSLASVTGTSDATVVRTVRKLGYDGLQDLRISASNVLRTTALPYIERRIELSNPQSGLSHLAATIREDASARVSSTIDGIDVQAYETALGLIGNADVVFTYGWGLSALGASYLALRLGRMGKSAHTIDATGFELAEKILPLRRSSTLVIFAPGRHLPDVDFIISHARAVEAGIVIVTTSLTDLADGADVTLYMASSGSGITAEPLTEMLVADILLLALTAQMPDESRRTYDLLTRLRKEALGSR